MADKFKATYVRLYENEEQFQQINKLMLETNETFANICKQALLVGIDKMYGRIEDSWLEKIEKRLDNIEKILDEKYVKKE